MKDVLDYEPPEPNLPKELPARNAAWAMEYLPLGGFVFGIISLRSGANYAYYIFIVSCLALLVAYGFFSWYIFRRAPRNNRTIGIAQATGIAFCLLIFGILVKLESWPHASNILYVSWFLITILALISGYFYSKSKTPIDREFYFKILTRTGMMTFLLAYWWWKISF